MPSTLFLLFVSSNRIADSYIVTIGSSIKTIYKNDLNPADFNRNTFFQIV